MESVWEKTASNPQFDVLNGNKNVDVLIIGGGIAGILCAYKLKNAGVDCMLVEATDTELLNISYMKCLLLMKLLMHGLVDGNQLILSQILHI